MKLPKVANETIKEITVVSFGQDVKLISYEFKHSSGNVFRIEAPTIAACRQERDNWAIRTGLEKPSKTKWWKKKPVLLEEV